jgi:hypothetical protein
MLLITSLAERRPLSQEWFRFRINSWQACSEAASGNFCSSLMAINGLPHARDKTVLMKPASGQVYIYFNAIILQCMHHAGHRLRCGCNSKCKKMDLLQNKFSAITWLYFSQLSWSLCCWWPASKHIFQQNNDTYYRIAITTMENLWNTKINFRGP